MPGLFPKEFRDHGESMADRIIERLMERVREEAEQERQEVRPCCSRRSLRHHRQTDPHTLPTPGVIPATGGALISKLNDLPRSHLEDPDRDAPGPVPELASAHRAVLGLMSCRARGNNTK